MKEYNQWELRFLQVLVPKKRYFEILKYNYDLMIDGFLWRGDVLMCLPNDKVEFVDAKTDYLDTITSMIKALKKDIARDSGVKYKHLFGKEEESENDN